MTYKKMQKNPEWYHSCHKSSVRKQCLLVYLAVFLLLGSGPYGTHGPWPVLSHLGKFLLPLLLRPPQPEDQNSVKFLQKRPNFLLKALLRCSKLNLKATPKEPMTYAWLELEYWGGILAPRKGMEPWGWKWSNDDGPRAGVGALWQGLEPQSWYWSLKAGIGP